MSELDYYLNDFFKADAAIIFEDTDLCQHLGDRVSELLGTHDTRRANFSQLKPFMDDFGEGARLLNKDILGRVRAMLKGVKAQRTDWPIPIFLAWLCVCYHDEEAVPLYERLHALDAKVPKKPRSYIGNPGDRAKARLRTPKESGVPASTLISVGEHQGPHSLQANRTNTGPKLSSPPTSSSSLHFSNAVGEFIGRSDERRRLSAFASDCPGFQWTQIAGGAGQGKSRLAWELIQSLSEKWEAGFLLQTDLHGFASLALDWRPTVAHLIVIDGVIGKEKTVGKLMKGLAANSDNLCVPVRVVLVERQRWDSSRIRWSPTGLEPERTEEPSHERERSAWFQALNRSDEAIDLAAKCYRSGKGMLFLNGLQPKELYQIFVQEHKNSLIDRDFPQSKFEAALDRVDPNHAPRSAMILARSVIDEISLMGWDCHEYMLGLVDENLRVYSSILSARNVSLSEDSSAVRLALLANIFGSLSQKDVKAIRLEGIADVDNPSVVEAIALTDGYLSGDSLGQKQEVFGFESPALRVNFVLHVIQSLGLAQTIFRFAMKIKPQATAEFLAIATVENRHHPAMHEILSVEPPTTRSKSEMSKHAPLFLKKSFARRPLPQHFFDTVTGLALDGNGKLALALGIYYRDYWGLPMTEATALYWFQVAVDAGVLEAKPELDKIELQEL